MADRTSYHVVPYVNGWQIRKGKSDDENGALGVWDHKDLAIDRAREIAKGDVPSQVIVHGENGRIQDEWTYGDDPRNIPG